MVKNNLTKGISILIPDGESYLLRAVVNSLAQIPGLKVYAMSNKKKDAMRYSRLLKKYSYYPKTDSDLDWIENINNEIIEHNIDLVMPIWEIGVKALTNHRSKVIGDRTVCLLPSVANFDMADNKWLLMKVLDFNNIPHPKSVSLEDLNQFDKTDQLAFPILIKPLHGFGGGHGIRKFNNRKELDDYFITNQFRHPYIAQELIEGNDVGCSVLCKHGEILAFTMQKGNLLDDRKFAPPAGIDLFFDQVIYDNMEKLLKSLNWSGVANIDMRYDKEDGTYKVLEINARYWGSTEASIIAGVNFPFLHVQASMGKDFVRPDYERIKYMNMRGVKKMIKRNKLFMFRLGFIFKQTPLKFGLKDPLPVLYKLIKNEQD